MYLDKKEQHFLTCIEDELISLTKFFMDLRTLLIRHEGYATTLYYNTTGNATWGVGHYAEDDKRFKPRQTICYRIIEETLYNDIKEHIASAMRVATTEVWDCMSTSQKLGLTDFVFNLGEDRAFSFVKAIRALREQDWDTTAKEMLDSKWAKQVGQRALTVTRMMRTV